jgi:hypothetical protein
MFSSFIVLIPKNIINFVIIKYNYTNFLYLKNKLFELLRDKTNKSEFVKAFKECNKILIKS